MRSWAISTSSSQAALRALAPADGARALRPAGQIEPAKLGHPRPLALGGVLSQRWHEGRLGQGEDRIARPLVDRHADREGALHLHHGIEEVVGAAGRVGAHQDRGVRVLTHRLGQLVERVDQHRDVVGGALLPGP
jgi:hypothetical protein